MFELGAAEGVGDRGAGPRCGPLPALHSAWPLLNFLYFAQFLSELENTNKLRGWQNLTQYFKAIILQLKINKLKKNTPNSRKPPSWNERENGREEGLKLNPDTDVPSHGRAPSPPDTPWASRACSSPRSRQADRHALDMSGHQGL